VPRFNGNETLIEFLEKWPSMPTGTVIRVEAGSFEFRFVLQARTRIGTPEPPVFRE
jgi:hypothetical protein